jgi:hypothetical protein
MFLVDITIIPARAFSKEVAMLWRAATSFFGSLQRKKLCEKERPKTAKRPCCLPFWETEPF